MTYVGPPILSPRSTGGLPIPTPLSPPAQIACVFLNLHGIVLLMNQLLLV